MKRGDKRIIWQVAAVAGEGGDQDAMAMGTDGDIAPEEG